MGKEKKPKSKFKRILKWTILGLLGVFLIGGGIFISSVVNNLPPMNDIENPQMDLSTRLYSANGKVLGTFHNQQNRVFIPIDSMSRWVKPALMATEDVRFFSHSGIDPVMPFTLVKDIVIHQRLRGGSGLSQQLARNLYQQVGFDNSVTRKVKEAIVAVILESRFTKDEIMQAYLNTTGFYGTAYGIEMGAQTLFGKSAADIELHEAALLIGLLKNPTFYSPTRNEERSTNRRNTVLDQMKKYLDDINEQFPDLKLNEEKIAEARAKGLDLDLHREGVEERTAAYFQDIAKKEVREILKNKVDKEYNLYTDGLKVYTTLDTRMQRYAEKAVQEHLTELQKTFLKELKRTGLPWKKEKSILTRAMKDTDRYRKGKAAKLREREIMASFEKPVEMRIWTWEGEVDTTMSPKDSVIHYMTFLQTGFMSMDPHSGAVKAWVGGINHRHFKYDHVSQAKRQVGSTFKPIVYAAGMKELHKPCDQVLDIPVTIELPDGKRWTPRNSGGKDDGLISYYEGLARSKNQVTAYMMKEVGPEQVCDFARALGVTSKLDCVPSLCLGTTDLTVKEMVNVYSTFANYGTYVKPYVVSRIEDKNGQVIYQNKMESREALDPETAFTMVRMMQGVVDHLRGTAHRLRSKYKFTNQIAGKTGTTQNNSDGWFMGVTPNLVSGVWVGCDNRKIRFRRTLYGQGANMALPIFANYMKYVYADDEIGLTQDPFIPPEGYQMSVLCPAPKKKNVFDEEGDVEDWMDKF